MRLVMGDSHFAGVRWTVELAHTRLRFKVQIRVYVRDMWSRQSRKLRGADTPGPALHMSQGEVLVQATGGAGYGTQIDYSGDANTAPYIC